LDCGIVDLFSRIEVTAKPNRHVPDRGSAQMDIVPDQAQLSQVMAQATAPAFILGAVAGFISILLGPFGATSSLIFRACGDAPNF